MYSSQLCFLFDYFALPENSCEFPEFYFYGWEETESGTVSLYLIYLFIAKIED